MNHNFIAFYAALIIANVWMATGNTIMAVIWIGISLFSLFGSIMK